jgi:hypothetical protein
MRRALIVLGAFAVGALADRFLIPLVEPHEVHYINISAEPGFDTCTLYMDHVTTVLGRQFSRIDEIDQLGCSQARKFPDTTWIDCRCRHWGRRADGGYPSDGQRDGGK